MEQLTSLVSSRKHISILYFVINFMILLRFLIMPKPQEFQERIFMTELKDLSAETGMKAYYSWLFLPIFPLLSSCLMISPEIFFKRAELPRPKASPKWIILLTSL